MRTPNFKLKKDTAFGIADNILYAGSYVTPVHESYLPKHVQDTWGLWVGKTYVMCYTRIGFRPIARDNLEEC